jgi:ABC-2 type transport system permease protein
VNVVVQLAIGLGTLSALIVSADAISGERERGTLEALLVTPLGRTDLVIGKLLAATSMWLAAIAIAVPYVFALAQGTKVVADALIILVAVGALVAIALTALGVIVSALAPSNRVSLASAIVILLVLAAPSRLPAVSTDGPVGWLLVRANPVSAGLHLASKVLVAGENWTTYWSLLLSPLIAAVVLTGLAVTVSRRITIGAAE